MSELHFQPVRGRAQEIISAILQTPELASCSPEEAFTFRLACEEVVVNITSYAYPDDVEGFVDVEIEKADRRVVIRFKDGGLPFNPLEHEMPDTTLSWDQREIGGLGILLVVNTMDDVSYAYEDHKNILTIEKETSDPYS